ncbi:MAG: phosphatidate cytidylyltransferase [Chloroflexota bacterium]
MLENNLLALFITFVIALIWLRLNDWAAARGWISNRLSRKIIHIGTGPIFVLCWLLFTEAPIARYLAASVPLLITGQFVLVGLGLIEDKAAVQAMTRTGDRGEILRGPLFYGLVFVLLTVMYWKDTLIGIVALMLTCGGDGLADILGRRWGRWKLPWGQEKSLVGSAGMFAGGWLCAVGVVAVYGSFGAVPFPLTVYLLPITWIALVGTLVESLPFRDVDNLTVTAAALLVGHWLL